MNKIYFIIIYNFYTLFLSAYSVSYINNKSNNYTKIRPITIVEDGQAIIKKGVFWPGCYYNESVSDHAPVLYKNSNLATYNISAPLSHFLIQSRNPFLNHKFHTDDKGSLISKNGGNTGFLGHSEVVLLKSSTNAKKGYAAITNVYIARMKKLFQVIKNIFINNPEINHLLLQEVPGQEEKTLGNENIHDLLREILNSTNTNLSITFFDTKISKKITTQVQQEGSYKSNLTPDVALISRSESPLLRQTNIADYDSRFVPFCNKNTKTCYLSAHMPSSFSEKELQTRCSDLKNITNILANQGYKSINIAGDFNTSAQRIAKECARILPIRNFNITIHTTKGGTGNSCKDNNGNITSKNIDIMIKYQSRL